MLVSSTSYTLQPASAHLSPRPVTLFVHFSGSGGTSVVNLAREHISALRVPPPEKSSPNANLGCASGVVPRDRAFHALPHGVTTRSGRRCDCSDLQQHAEGGFNWWANENPVVAPLRCAYVEYWTVLRHPIDRILSRLFKPPGHARKGFRFISIDQAKAALANTTWFGGSDDQQASRHEFTGSSALNNWHVRSLAGPSVYLLPLGAVTKRHELQARQQLAEFQVILPMENLTVLPAWLSHRMGVCIDAPIGDDASGTHSGVGAERDAALRDKDFMDALSRHNSLDEELYTYAKQLFEEKYHGDVDGRSNPCGSARPVAREASSRSGLKAERRTEDGGAARAQPRISLRDLFAHGTKATILFAEPGEAARPVGLSELPNISKLDIAGLYNVGTNFAFDTFHRNCVAVGSRCCRRSDGTAGGDQACIDACAPGENCCGPCACPNCPLVEPGFTDTQGDCVGARTGHVGWQVTYRPDPSLLSERQTQALDELGGLQDEGRLCDTNLNRRNASYVCYGKHTALRTLRERFPANISSADCDGCAVLVVVRHPLWWAQSMCQHRYDCALNTAGEQCSHISRWQAAPDAVSCTMGRRGTPQALVSNYSSLIHQWAEWYGAYAAAGVSQNRRVFIRYEDLLFRTAKVVGAICPKMGLHVADVVTLESDAVNPSSTGEAFERPDPEEMLASYDEDDLDFAEQAIPSELLLSLDYTVRLPERSSKDTTRLREAERQWPASGQPRINLSLVHIPKTGGSSIELYGKAIGVRWGSRREDWPRPSPLCFKAGSDTVTATPVGHGPPWHVPPRVWAAQGHDPYAGQETFCVVRNPFTRIISEFVFLQMTNSLESPGEPCSVEALNRWVHESLGKLELLDLSGAIPAAAGAFDCHLLPCSAYASDCTHVLAFETLDRDFAALMSRQGVTDATLPHTWAASCELPAGKLDQRSVELVRTVYQEDFLRYNYSTKVPTDEEAAKQRTRTPPGPSSSSAVGSRCCRRSDGTAGGDQACIDACAPGENCCGPCACPNCPLVEPGFTDTQGDCVGSSGI